MRYWKFWVQSFVPFTPAWRAYRDVVEWIDAADERVRLLLNDADDLPPFPKPLPRNPEVMLRTVEVLLHLVEGLTASAAGNDALAAEFLVPIWEQS